MTGNLKYGLKGLLIDGKFRKKVVFRRKVNVKKNSHTLNFEDKEKSLCAILLYVEEQLCTQGFLIWSIFVAVTIFLDQILNFFRISNFCHVRQNISRLKVFPGGSWGFLTRLWFPHVKKINFDDYSSDSLTFFVKNWPKMENFCRNSHHLKMDIYELCEVGLHLAPHFLVFSC